MKTTLEFDGILKEAKEKIEEIFAVRALIISIGGSHSLGLANPTSDIDLYLIYKIREKRMPELYSCFLEKSNVKVDIMCHTAEEVLQNIKEYNIQPHLYPTFLHRNENMIRLNENVKLDMKRDDFLRGLVYRTILTKYVLTDTSVNGYRDMFQEGLKSIDVVDFYYTRAKGNYEKCVVHKDMVSVRKYLYMLHEVLYCISILKYKSVPPIFFKDLLLQVDDKHLLDEINKLYDRNRESNEKKEKLMIPKVKCINDYISDGMKEIERNIYELENIYLM